MILLCQNVQNVGSIQNTTMDYAQGVILKNIKAIHQLKGD